MLFASQLVWPLLALVPPTTLAAAVTSKPLIATRAVRIGSTSVGTPTSSTGIATHTIQVGHKSDPHQYMPSSIKANVGDIVIFEFYPTNHSVVEADFLAPCVPAKGDNIFYSGPFESFNERSGNLIGLPPTWSMRVNHTKPTFFYCTAIDSCQKNGMVGAINPNSSQTWQAQYDKSIGYPNMLLPGQNTPPEGSESDSGSGSGSGSGSSNDDSGSKHSLSTGAIAGIAVAGVAFIVILVALFFVLGRNRVYSQWMSSQDGRTERTARWAFFNSGDQYSNGNRKSEISNAPQKPGHIDVTMVSSPDPNVRTFSPGTENVSDQGGSPAVQQGYWSWHEGPVLSRSSGRPTELEGHPIVWEAPGSTPGNRF